MSNQINFSNEEAKAQVRDKIVQNISSLTSLTKSTIKSSKSNELFNACLKAFAATESNIDNTGDKLNRINIITSQLKFQAEAIQQNCASFKEICDQIHSFSHQHPQEAAIKSN